MLLPEWKDQVRRSFAERDYRLDGGEPLNKAAARAYAALKAVLDAERQRPAVAVLGNLISLVLGQIETGFSFTD